MIGRLLLLAMPWIVVSSADARDSFTIIGAGVESCGTWTAETHRSVGSLNHSWLLGYVTAFNRYWLSIDKNVAQGTNAEGLIAWMDNYCQAHPLDNISKAADNLIDELLRTSGAR
jgi:hypothetical protein